MTHRVLVNGAIATKPSRLVDPADSIELRGEAPRYVSRGGEKLEGALDVFAVDPAGCRCIDAGASTGGFTDCLLQRGAREVVAIDVGYGQLHERLVADPRVTNIERTNVRTVEVGDIGGPASLLVADLSFISLRVVMGALVGLVEDEGELIMLVKPQFEAGRREASRGKGVIRDPAVWLRVLDEVAVAAEAAGAPVQEVTESPIRGADGNVEFCVLLRRGAEPQRLDLARLVASIADVTPSP